MSKPTKVERLAANVIALERTMQADEQAMMQNEQFKQFLQAQKEAKAQIAEVWAEIEKQMLAHDIKSIKGDWGTITIAERLNWKVTGELSPRYYKKVIDTTKLSTLFRLEGKAPEGAEPYYTKYLTKRIKDTSTDGK